VCVCVCVCVWWEGCGGGFPGSSITRLGRRPFPSGRWPAPKSIPDLPSASQNLRERGPGGGAEPGKAGGTKRASGSGKMLRSPAPHPPGSWALPDAQVAGSSALQQGVCSSGGHKDSLPRGPAPGLSLPPSQPSVRIPASLPPTGCQASAPGCQVRCRRGLCR
jgi:hypothetical protein